MSLNTVAEFAAELKRTPDTLLEQLQAAGVPKRSVSDELTETDKQQLLSHLQSSSGVGGERKKITLTKRSTSEIKQADASGKASTIQVEVRKKRTFIQREDPVEVAARAAQVAQAAEENKELVRREEEAYRLQDAWVSARGVNNDWIKTGVYKVLNKYCLDYSTPKKN